jgi:hypothetical protein
MLALQLIIESEVPTAELKFKYRIPFYYHDNGKPFCYLNQSKDYVDLGFWHAAHLSLHPDKLISKNRKHMRSLRYFSIDDIDQEVLIDLLREACRVKDRPYYS